MLDVLIKCLMVGLLHSGVPGQFRSSPCPLDRGGAGGRGLAESLSGGVPLSTHEPAPCALPAQPSRNRLHFNELYHIKIS